MPRNPCLRVWPETHSIPLIQSALLKKASFFLQNDALIAILIVKGREVVFWKACAELCHAVGSGKTRNRKSDEKKVVSGFQPSLVFQAGSDRFTIGQTRISGFGLKCTGSRSCAKMALFYQCFCVRDTGKKRAACVFWISTSRKFQAKPLNTGRAF